MSSVRSLRIGHGYDLHRLEPLRPEGRGRPLVLAGVRFEHPAGPVGHSDGDVLYHAVADAVLAAAGLPDIGELFPDNDPALDGLDSRIIVEAARTRLADAGWEIVNVDATLICEKPKIAPRKAELIAGIASALGVEAGQVNLKGKTHEKVDAVGEGRAIEVHVVALISRREDRGAATGSRP